MHDTTVNEEGILIYVWAIRIAAVAEERLRAALDALVLQCDGLIVALVSRHCLCDRSPGK